MKKKVLLIFRSRPECIKLAPIFLELKKSLIFDPLVCTSDQTDELLAQTLNDFKIAPDYDLSAMQTGQLLAIITIGTFDESRSIVASDSDIEILFVPTTLAKEQLLTENYKWEDRLTKEDFMEVPIYVTGSTAIDSLQWAFDNGGLDNQAPPKPILITAQYGGQNICAAALELAKENRVIFILPPSLWAHSTVLKYLSNTAVELVKLPPYSNYINLIRQSYLILTDSGELQEIGPALDIPVLILGDKTEYSEGVRAGAARLVGTNQRSIVHNVKCLLNNRGKYDIMVRAKNPYGDGRAAHRIIKILEEKYGLRKAGVYGESSRRPQELWQAQ